MEVDKRNNILAKPSGITLGQHRSDVVSEVSDICQIFISTCEKYKKLTGKDLAMRLSVSAKWHDNGKACKNGKKHVGRISIIINCGNKNILIIFLKNTVLKNVTKPDAILEMSVYDMNSIH